jgi:hypothetical protein
MNRARDLFFKDEGIKSLSKIKYILSSISLEQRHRILDYLIDEYEEEKAAILRGVEGTKEKVNVATSTS